MARGVDRGRRGTAHHVVIVKAVVVVFGAGGIVVRVGEVHIDVVVAFVERVGVK